MPYIRKTRSSSNFHSHHHYSGKKTAKNKRAGISRSTNQVSFNGTNSREIPTLLVEPSSDNDEAVYPDKPRSHSYSNYETLDSSSLSYMDFVDDSSYSKYFKNYFRRRGKSMDISKPCVHCILLREIDQHSHESLIESDDHVAHSSSYTLASSAVSHECLDTTNSTNSYSSLSVKSNIVTSNYLQVPNQNEFSFQTGKTRSKSIDQVLELFKHSSDEKFVADYGSNFDEKCHSHNALSTKCNNYRILSKSRSLADNQNALSSHGIKHLSTGTISSYLKSGPDWSIDANSVSHIWVESNLTGDLCYLTEQECEKNGIKRKCTSCKIVIHQSCLPKLKFECRPTFREAGVRDYRDEKKKEDILLHHWVHKKRQDGKCKQCGKSFQSKFSFNYKEIVAVQCSWCKSPYHNKAVCFSSGLLREECSKGKQYDSIIPPSWIIKMPSKHSFQSSIRKPRSPEPTSKRFLTHQISFPIPISSLDNVSECRITVEDSSTEYLSMTKSISLQSTSIWSTSIPFVVKPIPQSGPSKPLIVFLNPKSGGNAGIKLMRKFQWLLNPRQVFDISDGGPKLALELFGRVPNLRILICGGDGTVGWVLLELDSLKISPSPPIAILPLGTGNDLARSTNWGGGYSDEPLSKIISCVEEGAVKPLNRWNVTNQLIYDLPQCPPRDTKELTSNYNICSPELISPSSVVKLPLNVFNNYFSLGADAATALEFHESREANPEKFNSRLKNKMFYVGIGGKDVLKRSWKDLSDHVTLVCDNIDYTPKIKEMKPHLLLFLNIPRYSAGTLPWGNPSSGFEPQSFNDEKFEVMGLTAVSLAALQVGGHADRICQCAFAVIKTTKTIPMQIDGEPFRLLPSQIEIKHHNNAQIIMKPKRKISVPLLSEDDLTFNQYFNQSMNLSVFVIPLIDYEEYSDDKNKILEAARFYGMITERGGSSLSYIRKSVLEINSDLCQLDSDFAFLDATTSDRFFRIGRIQEDNHYLMDICFEHVFVLDPVLSSQLNTNDNEFLDVSLLHFSLKSKNDEVSEIVDSYDTNVSENKENHRDNCNDIDHENYYIDLQGQQDVLCDDRENGSSNGTNSDVFDPSPVKEDLGKNTLSELEFHGKVFENKINNKIAVRKYVDADDINNHFLSACKLANVDQVQNYILDGADFMAVDNDGLSGLHLAAISGNIAVVHYLINNAPKSLVERKDQTKGQTALHKAAQVSRQSVCSLLISAGASPLSKDGSMKTPSQLTSDPNLRYFLQKEEISEDVDFDSRKVNT